MPETLRSCAKTACRWPAAASLSYRYDTRQVWLLDLAATPDPSLYDLCPHHADALVVPKGWTRVDDRVERPAIVEPAAAERVAAAVSAQPRSAPSRRVLVSSGNRYESLVRDLPRLAAELSAAPSHGAGGGSAAVAAALPAAEVEEAPGAYESRMMSPEAELEQDWSPPAAPAQAERTFEPPPAGAVPLHGEPPPEALAGALRDAATRDQGHAPEPAADPDADQLAGQLVMPGLADSAGAVVIDMAGPRRRRARTDAGRQPSSLD